MFADFCEIQPEYHANGVYSDTTLSHIN